MYMNYKDELYVYISFIVESQKKADFWLCFYLWHVIWEFTIFLIHCTCICHVDVSKRNSSFLVIIMYSLPICFTLDWTWSNISRLCQFLIWMKSEIMASLKHRCLRTEPTPLPPPCSIPSTPKYRPLGLHSFFFMKLSSYDIFLI